MRRRTFLAALIAEAVIDPDRLLWVPGKKKIFIPPTNPALVCNFISSFQVGDILTFVHIFDPPVRTSKS